MKQKSEDEFTKKELFFMIKENIGLVENRLGLRIASLGIIISVFVVLIIELKWDEGFWVLPIFYGLEMFFASVGIIPIFSATNVRRSRKKFKEYNDPFFKNKNSNFFTIFKERKYFKANKYYFRYIAQFKSTDEYIDYCKSKSEECNDRALMDQIYINAKIANFKAEIFENSFFGIVLLKSTIRFFFWVFKK